MYATFECQVTVVHEDKKAALSKSLYEKRKKEVGKGHAATDGTADSDSEDDSDEDDLIDYESTA